MSCCFHYTNKRIHSHSHIPALHNLNLATNIGFRVRLDMAIVIQTRNSFFRYKQMNEIFSAHKK